MSDLQKTKSRIAEDLVTLYLRLNGYFTTGFILHSPIKGRNEAEIDCIAVRFPHSEETERVIGPDQFLQPSAIHIDVAFCEVKLEGQNLQFNKALRKDNERFERVLRWIGLFSEEEIKGLAPQVVAALTPQVVASPNVPEVIVNKRARIRGLVFSPERNCLVRNGNEPFFIGGDVMFDYVWKCLCPDAPRLTCATAYDFSSWGHLEPIVSYFKQRGRDSSGAINDLYDFILSKPTSDNYPA